MNLRVTEAEVTLKKPEVVHISLDDTKAEQANEAKSDKSDKTDASASAKSDEKTATKAQPKAAVSEEKVEKTVKAESDNDKSNQAEAQQTKAEEQKPAKSEEAEKSADSEAKKADTVAPKAQKANEEPEKEKVEAAKQKAKSTVAKPAQENEAESDSGSLSFDTDELFAERYVTAQKFGQASNDPRLIKASLMKQSEVAETEQSQAVPAVVITGTVGQFIHTHLAQPSMRLAKDGVIACFLAALNAHKETSGSHSKPTAKRKSAKQSSADSVQAFSFVNYGYQSLSPSYLQRFAKMTSAVAAHNIEQGKTEVEPSPIGARASNDPRGQHPDYTAPKADTATKVEANEAATAEAKPATPKAKQQPTAEDKTSAEAAQKADSSASKASMASLLTLNVGGFVNQVLGQEGLDIIKSGQTEAAFLKAMNQPSDLLLSAAQRLTSGTPEQQVAQGLEQPAKALVVEPQADAIGEESSEVLQEAKSEAQDNSASASNKTSIETYKSMIENISEQLLPQTGLLNLTSPKVPKARSRKTKEEPKKQTQADNEASNNNDSQ